MLGVRKVNKKVLITGLIGIILILSSYVIIPKLVFANPDDTILYTIADAFVSENLPDNNYGDDASAYVLSWVPERNHRYFLKFDLSEIPFGSTISFAELRITCYSISNLVSGVTDVQARHVADDSWTEFGIKWNNQPDFGDVEDTQVPSIAIIEWNVTDYTQDELDNDEIISFCMKSVTESYDTTARYSFYRTDNYGNNEPELYIEYTEEEETIFVTWTFNDGGNFYMNFTMLSNSSMIEYDNGTLFTLMAVSFNSSYLFLSFNWTGGSSVINLYNLTLYGNNTVWCYFGLVSDVYDSGYDVGYAIGAGVGYTAGYSVGYTDGVSDGYADGYSVGYDIGYDIGYADGISDGYTETDLHEYFVLGVIIAVIASVIFTIIIIDKKDLIRGKYK